MSTSAKNQDNDYNGGRSAGVKVWACRVGKRQQGPTHQNDSGRSNGSVSFSSKGASNKESTRPEYWTQDGSSGDGVLPGIADMVF